MSAYPSYDSVNTVKLVEMQTLLDYSEKQNTRY